MSNQQDLIDLVLALHDGTLDADDLDDEQTEMAIEGYRLLIAKLEDDPSQAEVVAGMKILLKSFEAEDAVEDEFEDAIVEAESRGSTYFELERDILH